MKDYASMSDQQINREVQKLTGMGCMSGNGVLIIADGRWRTFDPCNNPADAWPIITSSMISIRPVGNDGQLWEASGMGGMKADYDKNPLRSAMIVFLMMKESEKFYQSTFIQWLAT